jgi:hypothetical protein
MPRRFPALREHALKMRRVVRFQDLGPARQVQVPESGSPEAQGGGTHQRRHQPDLGALQRAHGVVGGNQRAGAYLHQPAGVEVDAPIVQADRDVEEPGVDPGEIEVEEPRELVALEHDVVAEQVGVDRAARQRGVGRRGGDLLLVVELVLDHARSLVVEERQDDRDRLGAPGQAAQVRLLQREVGRSQVHAREHGADARRVGVVRSQVMVPWQAVDHRGGLARQAVEQLAVGVAIRPRHGDAAPARCSIRRR